MNKTTRARKEAEKYRNSPLFRDWSARARRVPYIHTYVVTLQFYKSSLRLNIPRDAFLPSPDVDRRRTTLLLLCVFAFSWSERLQERNIVFDIDRKTSWKGITWRIFYHPHIHPRNFASSLSLPVHPDSSRAEDLSKPRLLALSLDYASYLSLVAEKLRAEEILA